MFKTRTVQVSVAMVLVSVSLFLAPAAIPAGHAYGQAQWQAGFSGNFSNSTSGAKAGFWGWCDFAGSASDGQSGTEADCQLTSYFFNGSGASTGNLFKANIQGTAWSMQPTTMGGLPGLPPNDFFITKGTATVTGPLIVTILKSGAPVPPGCTVSGETGTCPLSFWQSIGLISADTGIPAAPGHYSFATILEVLGIELPPGNHIVIQVAQIPQ